MTTIPLIVAESCGQGMSLRHGLLIAWDACHLPRSKECYEPTAASDYLPACYYGAEILAPGNGEANDATR